MSIDALLEGAYTLISAKAPEEDPDRRAITHYCGVLKEAVVDTWKNRPRRILSDWRYCHVRRTYRKEMLMLEVGLSPIVSKEAENCWKAIQNVLILHGEAAECFGIAPKGDLERRIEATLKGLKIYDN